MTLANRQEFESFVQYTIAEFVESVDAASTFAVAVQDCDRVRLVGSRIAEAAYRAPVDVHGDVLGYVATDDGSPIAARLATELASDLATRYVSEHDLDHMTDRLSECYDEMNLIFQLARTSQGSDSFEETCRQHVAETAELLANRTVVFSLRGESWTAVAHQGHSALGPDLDADEVSEHIHRAMADLATASDREAVRLQDACSLAGRVVPYVAVPVLARSDIRGFVAVFTPASVPLPETGDVRLLECVAQQLSNTTTTHALVLEIRDVLFNTVRALVATIDAKDPYTRGHSERVYQLSVALGERIGLSADELQMLAWSALLHDIGKIAIPNEILRKPGRLTAEEFEIIKTHPDRGCRVIEEIPQFRGALDGIRHHHERYDGHGYPNGLAGENIPLMGRIIGIADTFDAMVTSRAYREARSRDEATAELERSAGTQLDPTLVRVFLELLDEGVVGIPSAVSDSDRSAA